MLALTIAGCDTPPTPEPTLTPTFVVIPASPTVNPLPPTPNTNVINNADTHEFTPAAQPISPNGTSTSTPVAIQTNISLHFITSEGLNLVGTFYVVARNPAPTVLLLHMLGGNKESWQPFAKQLQAAGYNVLAIDLRGYGATGGQPDWTKAPQDVNTILNQLADLPGVDPKRISVIGANSGANVGLNACAKSAVCKTLILLSPALDYQGLKTSDAMTTFGAHPVLIVASHDDQPSGLDSAQLDKLATGDHRLIEYDGAVHGIPLLSARTDLVGIIVQWLDIH